MLIEYLLHVLGCFTLATFIVLFVFQQFDYVSWCGSLCLSCLLFVELLGVVDLCLSSDLGIFWLLFIQVVSVFSVFVFWDSCVYTLVPLMVHHKFFSDSIISDNLSSGSLIHFSTFGVYC